MTHSVTGRCYRLLERAASPATSVFLTIPAGTVIASVAHPPYGDVLTELRDVLGADRERPVLVPARRLAVRDEVRTGREERRLDDREPRHLDPERRRLTRSPLMFDVPYCGGARSRSPPIRDELVGSDEVDGRGRSRSPRCTFALASNRNARNAFASAPAARTAVPVAPASSAASNAASVARLYARVRMRTYASR